MDMTTQKLVLPGLPRRKPSLDNESYAIRITPSSILSFADVVHITKGSYQTLTSLKARTGISFTRLLDTLITYAADNTVIEYPDEDDAED